MPESVGPESAGPESAGPESPRPISTGPESRSGERSLTVAIIGGVAGLATIIASFLTQLTVTSDTPIEPLLGDYKLNDLATAVISGGLFSGTNLQVGIIIAGMLLLLGGALAWLGRSIGAGLVAGAALALAPFIAVIWGNMSMISDGANQRAFVAKQTTGVGTFVDSNPTAGFYLLLGAATLAVVGMCISLVLAGIDARAPFNRALCAAGALAAAVAAGGQLIPEHDATFRNNFSNESLDVILISGRLAVIGLVVMCGVMGFLRADRWGLGLAVGALSIYAWQWFSSITELGDLPAAPAFGNPGGTDAKPTIVTTIGLVAVLIIAASTMLLTMRKTSVTTKEATAP